MCLSSIEESIERISSFIENIGNVLSTPMTLAIVNIGFIKNAKVFLQRIRLISLHVTKDASITIENFRIIE